MGPRFSFTGELWESSVASSWVFVTVPEEQSDEINDLYPRLPGFGSVKVEATVGTTSWSTSLFPSKELGAYVMPFKRTVRDRERLEVGDAAEVTIQVVMPD